MLAAPSASIAAFGRPVPSTSDELNSSDGPNVFDAFDLFGEKPSHHQTPIARDPAALRSTDET